MKNLLKLCILLVLTALVFPSCSSKFSVSKRHYTKGFYFAHSKGKSTSSSLRETKPESPVSKPAYEVYKETAQEAVAVQQAAMSTPQPLASVEQKAKTSPSPAAHSKKAIAAAKPMAMVTTPGKQSVRSLPALTKSGASDRDALSLFWIVILVILVLWVLGLLAGGFGLGGLVNLLLLVALILLILWLLRVV